MNRILIQKGIAYDFVFENMDGEVSGCHSRGEIIYKKLTGSHLETLVKTKTELSVLYHALSRAIEEGDNLKTGIVIGQTLTTLKQLI